MAHVITSSGVMRKIKSPTGATFTVRELARYVETLAQWRVLELGNELLFYNQDGDDLALPLNETATAIIRKFPEYAEDSIYGQCVLARRNEMREMLVH
jgi:hypothetical protein